MKRLLALVVVVACGYEKPLLHTGGGDAGIDAVIVDAMVDAKPDATPDAPLDAPGACNVLAQTGCPASDKCTWIVQSVNPAVTGQNLCAPNGTVPVGGTCTRPAPGPTAADDCTRGSYCFGPDTGGTGVCKAICDTAGGQPSCGSNFVCESYDGTFANQGSMPPAGVCDPSCDPLADNNFLGATGNNRTGTACGSDGSAAGSNGFIYNKGCYGFPSGRFGVTKWTCSGQVAPSRFHRTACDTTVHTGDRFSCANSSGNPYLNGCASGYEPIFNDSEGSSQTDCIAMCAPANCYNAGSGSTSNPSCGTNLANLSGKPGTGHQCLSTNLQYAGTFDTASSTVNGEQCFYSWLFEFDANNQFVMSATSDTVGFCADHSKYKYDPTGGSNYNTNWPRCDLIGLGSQGFGVMNGQDATQFGCVDTATARAYGDITFTGKSMVKRPLDLRLPYSRNVAPSAAP